MGTEYTLLDVGRVQFTVDEFGGDFCLNFEVSEYGREDGDWPRGYSRSSINRLEPEELEEVVMKMLDVLSYHRDRETNRGFIDRLVERNVDYKPKRMRDD